MFLRPTDGEPWPLDFKAAETANPTHYPAARLSKLGDDWRAVGTDGPSDALLKTLGGLTVVDWLRENDASPAVIGLFLAVNWHRPTENGALTEAFQEILEEEIKTFVGIKGGNDLLPPGHGRRTRPAGHDRRPGRTHPAPRRPGGGHCPTRRGGGRTGRVRGRPHRLRSAPGDLAGEIPIEPRLPADHRRALSAVEYARSAKTVIQTRTRFWADLGARGLMIAGTDTPADRVWDVGVVQAGDMGLLHQYNMASQDKLERLADGDRWRRTAHYLDGVLPGLIEQTVYHSFWDWARQPWVKGGIPNILPGQGDALRRLPRAVGRLHFVGDYTTSWGGWMQGAIQSGLRAARAIDPTVAWTADRK